MTDEYLERVYVARADTDAMHEEFQNTADYLDAFVEWAEAQPVEDEPSDDPWEQLSIYDESGFELWVLDVPSD